MNPLGLIGMTTAGGGGPGRPSIADPFLDLLTSLDESARHGLVHRLAVGYYEGWRPTRAEVALLVDLESCRITEAEYLAMMRSSSRILGQQELPTKAGGPLLGADPAQPSRHDAADPDRSTNAAALSLLPSDLQAFSVDCGALAEPFRFITRGLSYGRDDGQHKLVSLYYELLPPTTMPAEPFKPVFFIAPILCVPDVPTSQTVSTSQTTSHTVGTNSVIGSRGPWTLSAAVRHLKFLIYEQSPDGSPYRRPAGALRVDIQCGEADWLPVIGRRAARRARKG